MSAQRSSSGMVALTASPVVRMPRVLEMRPFQACWAEEIAGWVTNESDLRLLAPGTEPPLTGEKVAGWPTPDGYAAVGCLDGLSTPIAYGEVNPIRRRKACYWLGHVIVKPDQRGRGIGLSFVRSLLGYAFDQRSARLVALIVFPDNTPAIECYLRAGFRVSGEEMHTFRDGAPQERLLRLEINRARMGA